MPHLTELVERHKNDPFALIGINVGDKPEAYRAGVKKYKVSWLSAYQGEAIADMYDIAGYPTYLVLDVDGKIAYRGHTGSAIDKVVADLLAKAKK